ncbi:MULTISPECIES: aminoacyl-tRNA hydrolase [Neptuniibacter]|jgi:PTH1 family peptidyl-tRNA hydrolase|uniref:aminoacyl-tRNA hydrolase n=1 Tax=Neptuniibacter TaxID=459520 RepID=UPI000835F92F|nr:MULTISPECIES: aminoacyl-tRNA hydrolase [Neptuniibacter]MDO6514496.1 aminoacyl-tRNA hydrolase [Neptuniibacter sp. 2_MG-2023]MDO6594791.1 aminoacyl-tRNA hydrolase [Neptuniibacter sp. 1_MG-2023]
MKDKIQLIVGLGNPGDKYAQTRHNAGAEFVEQLAARHLTPLKPEKKYHGLYAKANINGSIVHLLVPTTFMNLSGQSVSALANFFKIPPESILVAHDELDLPPGIARFKLGGGHGGHNGLRDIISKLGNNKNFYRLRIGIGHPGHSSQVSGFVLNKAPAKERDATLTAIDEAERHLELAITGDWAKAMNQLHSFSAS